MPPPSQLITQSIRTLLRSNQQNLLNRCSISTSSVLEKTRTGRFKVSIKHDNPLTYEQAYQPSEIGHAKHWTAFNTANFPVYGLRKSETAIEDVFIRKFVTGTWHNLFVSEVLIKRQSNIIRIAGIVQRSIHPRKMYFLIGYTEEFLSYWLQCIVKLELQSVEDKKSVVFKYV